MAQIAAVNDSTSNLFADLAYWQTRAYDMQNDISSMEEQRKNKRSERL